jgi:hypothetical protein
VTIEEIYAFIFILSAYDGEKLELGPTPSTHESDFVFEPLKG